MDSRSALLIGTIFEQATLIRKEAYELMLAGSDEDNILIRQKFQQLEEVNRNLQSQIKALRVDFTRRLEENVDVGMD